MYILMNLNLWAAYVKNNLWAAFKLFMELWAAERIIIAERAKRAGGHHQRGREAETQKEWVESKL
jgi:hypothetical protein